jgi:hypothetical protein
MYKEWEKHFDLLDDEEVGRLMRAVFAFVSRGEESKESDRAVMMLFNMMRSCFVRDGEKWEETRQKRKENGSKGGIAKAENAKANLAKGSNTKKSVAKGSKAKNSLANVAVNVNENDNVNDYVNENEDENESVNDNVNENEDADGNVNDTLSSCEPEWLDESPSVGQSVCPSVQKRDLYRFKETTPTDFSKVDLSEAERLDLVGRSDSLTVERYITKIRDWQEKNRKLNSCPFITIRRWMQEDGVKPRSEQTYTPPKDNTPAQADDHNKFSGYDEYDELFHKELERLGIEYK